MNFLIQEADRNKAAMFHIGSLKISNPFVLAPMAGFTDTAARRTARRHGAGLVITEMISAAGLVRKSKKTRFLMTFHPEETPLGIQIFGRDPMEMAEAARIARDTGADFVDINLGCPVKKVCRSGAGSALLREPLLVSRILEAVTKAVDCPVTTKLRLGWDSKHCSYLEIARIAEKSGVQAIALHPRTRAQGFQGTADWDCVARLKEEVCVPVIGSGDIVTPQGAVEIMKSVSCDAVMIGRAARGNPWIFSQTMALLSDRPMQEVRPEERYHTVIQHLEWILSHYGKELGIKRSRFLLLHYARGLPGSTWFRKQMFCVENETSLRDLLEVFFLTEHLKDMGS